MEYLQQIRQKSDLPGIGKDQGNGVPVGHERLTALLIFGFIEADLISKTHQTQLEVFSQAAVLCLGKDGNMIRFLQPQDNLPECIHLE